MPSQPLAWLASQRATLPRVKRYLRETGRPDAAADLGKVGTYLEEFGYYSSHETVAEAALRVVRVVGPPHGMREKLAAEIKMMLHASRDAMRVRFHADLTNGVAGFRNTPDPMKVRFVASDGYYGEAFGIVRAMEVLGWGKYGAINVPGNLHFWFWNLQTEVLAEEHFGGSGECDRCLERYGRDDAGRRKA